MGRLLIYRGTVVIADGSLGTGVLGNLIKDGEIVGEYGSGRSIERGFVPPSVRLVLI